jgi:hypothetical protein
MQQMGQNALSAPEKREGERSCLCENFSKQRLERQMGQQWMGDKPLPEIRQIAVHKAHLLSQ